jgi:hypothetical protein
MQSKGVLFEAFLDRLAWEGRRTEVADLEEESAYAVGVRLKSFFYFI